MSLHGIALLFFHGSELAGCFNPIGTRGHVQIVGDINNRCQERRFPFFGRQLSPHPLARFHGIQRESVERGEPSHVSTEIRAMNGSRFPALSASFPFCPIDMATRLGWIQHFHACQPISKFNGVRQLLEDSVHPTQMGQKVFRSAFRLRYLFSQ
jgi:hypothetical protein